MKVVHFDIKDKYISLIEQGRKVTDIQEIRPKNRHFLTKSRNGTFLKDDRGISVPKRYDAVMFHSESRTLLVKIDNVTISPILTSEGKRATYEYKGETINAENIIFGLGTIYKKDNGGSFCF